MPKVKRAKAYGYCTATRGRAHLSPGALRTPLKSALLSVSCSVILITIIQERNLIESPGQISAVFSQPPHSKYLRYRFSLRSSLPRKLG